MSDDGLKSDFLPFSNQIGIKLTLSIENIFLVVSITFLDVTESVELTSPEICIHSSSFNCLTSRPAPLSLTFSY